MQYNEHYNLEMQANIQITYVLPVAVVCSIQSVEPFLASCGWTTVA